MRFSINKNTLQKNLAEHAKVVPIRTTLPVLSCVVFEVEKNTLTLKTSDLEQTIVSTTKITNEQKGTIALPLGKLQEIVLALPSGDLNFSLSDGFLVEINNNQGTYKITGRSADEFPETPNVHGEQKIKIKGSEVLDIIAKTGYAVSKDDLKPALCGVYFKILKNEITAVATDGHKLVKYIKKTTTKNDNEISLVLPLKFLNILKNNINKEDFLDIDVSKNHVSTKQKNLTIISRVIKENFPDFNSVIPTDNKIKIEIETQPLIECLKRVSIFSNKTTKQILLSFSSKGLVVSAQDIETSTSAKEHIECEFKGEDITTSYNAKYLMELLQHIDDKKTNLYLKTALTAAVFLPQKPKKETTHTALLMPMRLN